MCEDLLGFVMFSLLWPLHRICLWHTFSTHQFVLAGCQNDPAPYHLFPLQFVRFLGNPATGVNAVKLYLYLFLNTYPVLCQIKRLPLIGVWESLHLWHSRGWEYGLAQWTGVEVSVSQEGCKEGLMYPEGFDSPSRWEVAPMTFCCCKLNSCSSLSHTGGFFTVCNVRTYWEVPMIKQSWQRQLCHFTVSA